MLKKLGLGLMMLIHIKQSSILQADVIKLISRKDSNLVLLIGGKGGAVGLSFFRDYDSYIKSKSRLAFHDKSIVLEDPLTFTMLTKDIKSRKFDFLETTKKILELL